MLRISSSSNPKIKEIKSLYKKKERWNKGMFIIEGIKIVGECIDNNYPITDIIYSDELFNINGGEEIFNKIRFYDQLINVPSRLFKEISDTENPQGIMAIAKFRENTIASLFECENPLILLLEGIQDPGNMGTIIRTADAFNIDGIIITEGSVDIYNPKVVRSTMGSIFRVPIYHVLDKTKILKILKDKDYSIYSTSLAGDKYIQEINFRKASLVIIGNESKGVSPVLNSLADKLIKIPIPGDSESLNVGVASSIIMYEAMRQRLG